MAKIKSFPNFVQVMNFNYIKLILIILLLKTYPCFATNNLIININEIKIILEGNFVQGGLVKGKINKDLDIKFKEKVLRKTSDGSFVIGFGRDHPKQANLFFFVNQNWVLKKLDIKQRKYKTQVINGLEKKWLPHPNLSGIELKKKIKLLKRLEN